MKRLFLFSIMLIGMVSIATVGNAQSYFVEKSGDGQKGMIGQPFLHKIAIKLEATHTRLPAPNVAVDFKVTSGDATVTDSATTNAEGVAEAEVTAGNSKSSITVKAYITTTHRQPPTTRTGVFATYNLNIIEPVTRKLVTNASGHSNVWKKFIGLTGEYASNTPSIVDWSYAGYKQGVESIPDIDDLGLTYYKVTDYGAVPNDNQSDTQGIKNAIAAVPSGGGIVFFPPGKYDVMMDGDDNRSIKIYGSNVIVKGSGAAGSSRGGTTIKIHNPMIGNWLVFLFVAGGANDGSKTRIQGNFPRGSLYFDVSDASVFQGYDFVKIKASNLLGDDWDDHSSRPISDMSGGWTHILKGISIHEIHEIDRIEGNRVYLKSKTMTPLNSKYFIKGRNTQTGIGFEDLHIDGCLTEYDHNSVNDQQSGIHLANTAHSWIRRCRGSNISAGFVISGSYCDTVYGFIVDGHRGHYPGVVLSSTYTFVGLIEDHARVGGGMFHGMSVAGKTAGTVFWGIGGTIRGPDCHGQQPRHTLYDNYFGTNHSSASGTGKSQPHHLDGYLRWNNTSTDAGTFDLWPDPWYRCFTQGAFVGYKQRSANKPLNAYSENLNTHVWPESLYVAQLKKRLDYEPLWIEEIKADYENFYAQIFSTVQSGIETPPSPPNNIPVFNSNLTTYFEIDENTEANTNIGDPFIATDDDSDDTLTYNLKNTDLFTIGSTTGQITTIRSVDYESLNETHNDTPGSPLNSDPKGTHKFIVQVSDGEGGTAGIQITVNILDVNEAPKFIRPFGATSLYLYVDETNIIGKLVGNPITATDVDAGDILTYSLLSVDSDPFYADHYESFEINSETGQLKTKVAMRYIGRDDSYYLMKVRATDTSGLHATILVKVTVEDRSAPIFFGRSVRTFSVLQGTESDVNIGDPLKAFANGDTDDTDGLSYSISGDDAESFSIDTSTGQLKTKAALDSEAKYTIIANAFDGDLTGSTTVIINVITYPLFGRTQQVQDAIIAVLADVDVDVNAAIDVTNEHLSMITYLVLNNKSIETLKLGDFEGITSLIRIELEDNSLGTLPAGIFDGLSSLEVLRLFGNEIDDIPAGIFDGLSSLKELYLHSNALKGLPENAFNGLTSLAHLGLNDNKIRSLESDIFEGLTSLAYLHLHGNKLKKLESDVFNGLTSLNTLTLNDNDLKKLPDGIFEGLSISSLRLQDNKVDPLPLNVALEKVEQSQFKFVMPTAAPTDITFPLTVANGSIAGGRTSVHIDAGKTESNPLTVVRDKNVDDAVTVAFGKLPKLGWRYSGYGFSVPDDPLVVLGAISRAPGERGKPDETALLANYPNPFNPETWIPYKLARTSNLSITIYDIHGNVVRELALGHQMAGYYIIRSRAAYWDGRNKTGEQVSAGIYFYGFKTDDMSTVRKMVIMK